MNIALENQNLCKENKELWDRLAKVELTQLSNNIIITGIQEGPFEPYHTTKLRVYEMIATTIDSGDKQADLETTKKVEIIGCSRVGKHRHNRTRPISVTFKLRDDKELFLSCNHKLPAGIYANEEYPIHIKRTHDRLLPILRLAKSQSEYQEKNRLDGDLLLINGTRYTIDDLDRLPPEIATHKAAEKMNDTHIIFSGELSPYSNFHPCNFVIDYQTYHSSEQYIQYQKALTFGDSYVTNKILKTDTAMECKCLSYQINGVDAERWRNEGYDICYEGIKQKFLQNEALLARLKSTTPKILAKAMPDRLWEQALVFVIKMHSKRITGPPQDGCPECYLTFDQIINLQTSLKKRMVIIYTCIYRHYIVTHLGNHLLALHQLMAPHRLSFIGTT